MNIVAIHEAGHAVMATYYGVPVERMELRADSGTTILGKGASTARIEAAIYYAGLAAERRVNPHASFDNGCRSDLRALAQYTEHWDDKTLDAFYAGTLATVRMLWPFIKALAGALVRWRTLEGGHVLRVLGGLPRAHT